MDTCASSSGGQRQTRHIDEEEDVHKYMFSYTPRILAVRRHTPTCVRITCFKISNNWRSLPCKSIRGCCVLRVYADKTQTMLCYTKCRVTLKKLKFPILYHWPLTSLGSTYVGLYYFTRTVVYNKGDVASNTPITDEAGYSLRLCANHCATWTL